MNTTKCQMQDKDKIHEGRPKPVLLSRHGRFMLKLSGRLDPRLKRFIKHRLKLFTKSATGRNYPAKNLIIANPRPEPTVFNAGDTVRVRSIDEIRETLNSDNRLRGLKFLPEMEQYCDTTQRIFKPVERFLNECDYTIRKGKGLVLLENVFCQGIAGAGRCDRSCFYFWRVEWLEHVEKGD